MANPLKEKAHPAFPVTVVSHALKPIRVLRAVLAKVVREIEQRPLEDPVADQQEGDEQAPHAAIAVHEGVNGLKLSVRETAMDERRDGCARMQEGLEVTEHAREFAGRRWDENGFGRAAPWWPNPVL